MSTIDLVGVNVIIALVLAMLGLAKMGPFGLFCGLPSLVVALYFLVEGRERKS